MTAFLDGVASGDPTPDGIVLWTRVDHVEGGGDVELTWHLRTDSTNGGETERTGTATSAAATDHCVRVTVDGLAPGTPFTFWFTTEDGAESVHGRFRTLAVEPERVRFAVVCCAKFNSGFFNAYRQAAEQRDLDFVLHLGDSIYEAANVPAGTQTPGAGIGRDFDPLEECRTLDQYRQRYRQYRRDPDVAGMHAALPVIAIIDDHELADNAWIGGAEEHEPDRDGPWADRMAGALRAWEEWMPSRVRPTQGDQVDRTVQLGSLASLVLFEARTGRGQPGSGASILSKPQWTWLDAQFDAVGADRWLLLGMASSLVRFWTPQLSEDARFALRKLKLIGLHDDGPFSDLWDAYAHDRTRLAARLATQPSPRLIMSGDVHIAMESVVHTDGTAFGPDGTGDGRDGVPVAVEVTSPSLTSQNLDDKCGWVGTDRSAPYVESLVAEVEGLRWTDLDAHGYLVVEVIRESVTVEWWAVDTVLERTDQGHCIRRLVLDRDDAHAG